MIAKINGDEDFIAEDFLVKISDDQAPVKVSCHWSLSKSQTDKDVPPYFHSIDLLLSVLTTWTHDADEKKLLHIPDATGTVLENLVRRIQRLDSTAEAAIKVILVPRDGYVCRSDILDLRMRHSEFVDTVISFPTWDKHLPTFSNHGKNSLFSLLPSSAGAILAKRSRSPHYETLKLLQRDLEMRLSFDWILPTKPAARTVAVVAGRPIYEPKRGIYWSQGFFEAAQALGISLIVFDDPGHWLEGEEYAHLRDEFIAINMSNIEDLPCKMAEALKGRHIDGIVTFTDDYVVATAEAAEILGLPTEPARAMWQTHYKHEMRRLVKNESSIQAVYLKSVKELEDPALSKMVRTLEYPLIIKPCRGVYSRGIKKVTDDTSMRQAARVLEEDGLTGHGVLLETYVDGPEVDANFVLWDGQILFLEVNDNFPCRGDASGATPSDNFAETVQISNSALPPEEIEIIRSSLHHNILQLGFRSGVFHAEARLRNSSVKYQDVRGDGILDLAVSSTNGGGAAPSGRQTDVFLIEVNARPPGAGGTWATQYTYGVHTGALQLLRAIDDRERFEAMSKPFSFTSADPGDGGGAQYWTAHSMIPIHREKIRVPEEFFEKLYQILPEILPHVSRAELYAHPGTVVSPSGGIGWIGYVLLCSRTSRRHVLEMYHRVAKAAKEVLDTD
ncbi:hypothetical protein AJ79_09212 [Helicocarpus griseus UAMH5409]|uniref:ATP-grasp domain-containing protein n=1 Tax=Helicocarpus griseus UAMH5409 TaxID=1447875 RepID=A0A2B7WLJ8_9EURO|nr:hypothetical protein AJ79_09212 [Helicocarpus griseus UAMH5409]